MGAPIRLLVIAGSQRQGSFNRALAAFAAAHARAHGAQATEFDLRALGLPIYDGDAEARDGVPEAANQLLAALTVSDAVLVVTPEYNGFPTPLVINAFDWLSRLKGGLAATAGKPLGLLSASPGPLGGLRSMNFLRQFLGLTFGMLVSPPQFALSRAGEAFDEAGALRDPKAAAAVANVVDSLLKLAGALAPVRPA